MNNACKLQQSRNELISRIAALGPTRPGSISEQYVEKTLKDGSQIRRGPYFIYTRKLRGKTVSRRLTNIAVVADYRSQIENFRQFQELVAQLARVNEQLADLELEGGDGSKKNSS